MNPTRKPIAPETDIRLPFVCLSVLGDGRLRPLSRLLWFALLSRCSSTDTRPVVAFSDLASWFGSHRGTVAKHLHELERYGYLSQEKCFDGHRFAANRYTLYTVDVSSGARGRSRREIKLPLMD
jgi:hypothetical protein